MLKKRSESKTYFLNLIIEMRGNAPIEIRIGRGLGMGKRGKRPAPGPIRDSE
jgi:hypothetical protein